MEHLCLWFSWVDDWFLTGPTATLLQAKKEIMENIECDDSGEVHEFLGCKVDCDRGKGSIRITQPVLLQSFQDEFALTEEERPRAPGIPLKTLQLGTEPQVQVNDEPTTGRESGS
jgi:hypothetical protein